MKKITILLLAAIICLCSMSARADDREDAVALVKKAVAFYKANGMEKLIEEVNNSKGQFVNGALYVFIFDKDTFMLAQPFNQSLIGRKMGEVTDADGKYMVKEMVAVAKAKGIGWVDYQFKNPKTNEIAPKSTYVELADEVVVGCGFYRK